MSSVMTCRQATELDYALERFGLTPKHVKMMCSGDVLVRIKKVLGGLAEIKPIEYEIDFDKTPSIPNGWTLLPDNKQLPNRVRGKIKLDYTKVNLYFDDNHKDNGNIEGNKLREKLVNIPVLGAQASDFYLAHPHFIPEEWKGKAVFFWGSIYCDTLNNLCVRCLYWDDGRGWCLFYLPITNYWSNSDPSAVLAS